MRAGKGGETWLGKENEKQHEAKMERQTRSACYLGNGRLNPCEAVFARLSLAEDFGGANRDWLA